MTVPQAGNHHQGTASRPIVVCHWRGPRLLKILTAAGIQVLTSDEGAQLAVVYFTQAPSPNRSYFRRMMRNLGYQSIVD